MGGCSATSNYDTFVTASTRLDWNDTHYDDYGCCGGDTGFVRRTRTWKYHEEWCKAMDRVRKAFGGPEDILSPYHWVGYYGVEEKWSYEGACPLGSAAGGIQFYYQTWR